MRVQIEKLFPSYLQARVQYFLSDPANFYPKTKEIVDKTKAVCEKKRADKKSKPMPETYLANLNEVAQIKIEMISREEIDLLQKFESYMSSHNDHIEILVKLVIQKNIHTSILMQLVNQKQTSSLQFLALRVIRTVIDVLIMTQPDSKQIRPLLKVLVEQIISEYEQISQQVVKYLTKLLLAYPRYSKCFLQRKILRMLSETIKKQFEVKGSINLTQRHNSLLSPNKLINLLKICHVLLSATTTSSNFKDLKYIVMNLIDYLFSRPINVDFAIKLMLLLKIYVDKSFICSQDISMIFQHCDLIVRILKRYTVQRVEILQFFTFGVLLEKDLKNIPKNMLYCLEVMIDSSQQYVKEACWNILTNNRSKYCMQAILRRKSLMDKIFQKLDGETILNRIGFTLIVNSYIQAAGIQPTEKRDFIVKIIEANSGLLHAKEVDNIFIGISFLSKILTDSTLFMQKCEEMSRMGYLKTVQKLMLSETEKIRGVATALMQQIRQACSEGEETFTMSEGL